MPVLDIFEETPDHRSRNHVSDTLRDITAVPLKCDADDSRILHHRPAAVSRINLRTDLNGQVLVDRRMGVELKIDARNDPGRDRHALAADRISVSGNDRFQFWNSTELQR